MDANNSPLDNANIQKINKNVAGVSINADLILGINLFKYDSFLFAYNKKNNS